MDKKMSQSGSFASLFTVITAQDEDGQSNIELIKKLVDTHMTNLELGLDAFKAPSASARSGMASAINAEGKKYSEAQINLAKRLSDIVKLDETQALKIIDELVLEVEVPDTITEDMVLKVLDVYWKERSSLIASLGRLAKYAKDNETSPELQIPGVDRILSHSTTTITKLLGQWKSKVTETAPDYFLANLELLELWIGQSLTEQSALLETMISLVYAGRDDKSSLPANVLSTLLATDFGAQQTYRSKFKIEAIDLYENARILCLVFSVASLDLENLYTLSTADDPSRNHIYKSATQIKTINSELQSAGREQALAPFILAWSCVLSARINSDNIQSAERQELTSLAAKLVYVAMETLDVFTFLQTFFTNELFDKTSAFGTTYKRILFIFFELIFLDHEPRIIKNFSGLINCLSAVLQYEPELCILIWGESPTLGQGTVKVLETARGRFPLQFEPLLKLLGALATGGETSASRAAIYLHVLPSLTHLIPLSAPCIEQDIHPVTGDTIIRSKADVPFGILPDRPFMALPIGLTGHLVSAENTAQIVRWTYSNSGWALVHDMLDVFRQITQVDYEPAFSSVEVGHVKAILDLLKSLFLYPSVSTDLVESFFAGSNRAAIVPTLFAILDQSSKFQSPPLDMIASCLKCLTRLCNPYAQEIWLYLKQSSFLPSIITTTVQFTGSSQVQTSGLAFNLLSRFECVQGNYSTTLAFLSLIQELTLNAQQGEIWDSKELRHLKTEVLYPCLAYLQNDIFTNYDNWHYNNVQDRFVICSKILSIFNSTVDDLPLLSGSDNIGLSTLQEYLLKNFLYDGGKQLALPLVSIIGSGPDLAAYFSKYDRQKEMTEIQIMVAQGLKFVKSLLRHRKMAGGEPSFLEVYLVDRTVGRSNSSLIHVLASYSSFSCGLEAAHFSVDILTLLCSLTAEWPTRPSFVGYLGTTAQAQQLITTLINRVGNDYHSLAYRIALWNLITITLTTQPGLATLFLSNDRVDPVTGVLDDKSREIGKNSVVVKGLNILKRHDAMLNSEPEILPPVLFFFDTLWHNAKDHSVLARSIQENDEFWKNLGDILVLGPLNTGLETSEWKDVATQHGGDARVQISKTSLVSADTRSRAHAFRIIALAVHFQRATKGKANLDIDSLPKGLKEFFKAAIDKRRFLDWNSYIPNIHFHVAGVRELQIMSRNLSSPFDYSKLAVRKWDENYDSDYLPGASYMFDLERAQVKLMWRGTERDRRFIRTLFHVNLNWSVVNAEMQRLSAWRFFIEVVTSNFGTAILAKENTTVHGSGSFYQFVIDLLDHIERDTKDSVVLRTARQDCCLMLQSVIENTPSTSLADKKNLAAHFPEVVNKLQRVIHSPDIGLVQAFQSPKDGNTTAMPLLLTLLICYRSLHDKDVLTSLDAETLGELQKSVSRIVPLIAHCFKLAVQAHLLGHHDQSNIIVVLLAILEEICRPVWSPHPALWIPILRSEEVFNLTLQLCARSFSTANYESRPSFFEGSLNLLLALANVPEMAGHLVEAGVMSTFVHNGLSPLLQRGEINHLDEAHGDRGDWHQAWCMILATVTGLLRHMSSSEAFMQSLIGFIHLYGSQISKGLDSSTDRPLTSAKLEEMERITMLFYELAKNEARLDVLGGGDLLKAFFDRSLFILQHAIHLFTHPHTLASVIVPITRVEHKEKEAGQGSALVTAIEGRLAAVVRNILSAILAWTEPATILTKSNIEWPFRKTTIAPISNTPVYEPASIGTMFDLVQYATTSLKEWEARLEGKAGGAAGLFKDLNDDDQKDVSTTSLSSGASSSKSTSKLAWFGNLSTGAAPSTSGGASSSGSSKSTPPTSGSSGVLNNLVAKPTDAGSESAFATLSTNTGSSTRMISLLEDALVVIATQLGLYMYHPQLEGSVRRDIQDLAVDLVGTLNSTARMLQRFDNVPVQARKEGLGAEANAQIRSLRGEMIPVLKHFVQSKINIS
ncbi:hypothetical protein MVEG_03741 [Podila verticillata NRRL 6337]|nr:hypothetical protein MVEG_03741 [Podila verticillata NRRL 6337]